MKKNILASIIIATALTGCARGNDFTKCEECNQDDCPDCICECEEPSEIVPNSIDLVEDTLKIPYGTVLDELQHHALLTYNDGSQKLLGNDEYALTFQNNATFSVGEGKAILTYNKNENIKKEINYVVTPRSSASILFIGNSFSDDTIEYMHNIATTLGISLQINNLFIGSCTIDVHYNNLLNDKAAYEYRSWNGNSWVTTPNYKISTALKQESWDFVSLQQGSGSSGLYSTYSHLDDCVSLVKKDLINPNHTQFIWNMTWAYQQNTTHGEFANYNNDQMTMYNSIVSCVKKLNRDIFKVVIPSGTAIQNARTSYLGDTLTRDGFHLNTGTGRYIAALNAIKAITGITYGEVPFSPSLNSLNKAICLESVSNAWINPYEVTQSSHRLETQEELSEMVKNMTKLNVTFKRDYYFYSISPSDKTTPLGPNTTFICTNIFSKNDIPCGSIIRIAPGYRYRPEGWTELDTYWTGERPENVSTEYVKVDESWWGVFNYRGFNISSTLGSPLDNCYEEAEEAFSIYIPKH